LLDKTYLTKKYHISCSNTTLQHYDWDDFGKVCVTSEK